eukprot:9332589-Pyramimonas_sp.AAC.1
MLETVSRALPDAMLERLRSGLTPRAQLGDEVARSSPAPPRPLAAARHRRVEAPLRPLVAAGETPLLQHDLRGVRAARQARPALMASRLAPVLVPHVLLCVVEQRLVIHEGAEGLVPRLHQVPLGVGRAASSRRLDAPVALVLGPNPAARTGRFPAHVHQRRLDSAQRATDPAPAAAASSDESLPNSAPRPFDALVQLGRRLPQRQPGVQQLQAQADARVLAHGGRQNRGEAAAAHLPTCCRAR